MSPRTGDYYSMNLEYLGITDPVDKAIAQCINVDYGGPDGRYYIMLVDYLCKGEYYREKFILGHSELDAITGHLTSEDFIQLTRDKKLKELGI